MLQAHQLAFAFIVALCWLQAATAANDTALNDTGLNGAFCNSNTSIGFHPHPTDCSKYYYCYRCPYYCYPVILQCPNDYHWDVKAKRCACPTIAQCSCDSENSTTPAPPHPTWPPPPPTPSPYNPCHGEEFYPCPWDCTKFFHCDGAIAYLKECPAHLEWDTKSNRCEWPIIAQCSTDPTHRPPVTTPAPPPYTDTPYNPCHGAEFYPCPWDCTKFFHCDGAIAYLKDCPAHLEWDTKSNRCEWPRIAQCSTDPTHRPPPLTTPAPPPYTDTPYNPCNGAEFYPCPWDCTKFFHCDGAIAYLKDCPSNLEWDTKTNRCQWPIIAQCSTDPTHRPPLTTPAPPPYTDTPFNPCNGAEFYPCPWDCTKFFHCDGAIAYLKDCPSHLEWDTKTNSCQWPRIAQCSTGPTPRPPRPPTEPPAPYTDTPFNPCNGAEFYPCPWDCTKFFHCDGTIAYLKDCPSHLQWDTKSNRCEWPYIARCRSGRQSTT